MTKCCKCRRENVPMHGMIGRFMTNPICKKCFDKWHKFLDPYREDLNRSSGTPEFHKVWGEAFQKFLGKIQKEVVEFT